MGERCLVEDPNSRGRVYMPTRVPVKKRGKKSASKTSSKKSASAKHSTSRNSKKSSTGKRVTAKKSGRKRSPGGILTKAKEAFKTVLAGAASGAAEGAVAGAAEAGSKVTGLETATQEQAPIESKAEAAKK
jgi:hypothetical protein